MTSLEEFILTQPFLAATKDALGITKLFGQASARQYFRVSFTDSQMSYIIMKMPQGFASPAEEVTKLVAGAPQEFAFLNVQRYLHALGVAVPQVLALDASAGLVLLEDLGDTMLEMLVKNAPAAEFDNTYHRAIDTLIDLQTRTFSADLATKDCVAYFRFFNAELLNWEFIHFLEYGVEDRFGIKVNDAVRAEFAKTTSAISARIQAMPQGFVHRDFQSRNIMVQNNRLHLIDFQDALVGPLLYDLVALLCDSYIWFSDEQQQSLLNYYADAVPVGHPYHGKKSQVHSDFYVIALQRKLKDTGRFQYIHTVRGNSSFLCHVPWSLEYVQRAFAQLPEYLSLQRLLAEFVPELDPGLKEKGKDGA